MSRNKRIFLNVVATYGRSLYSLVCGLFTWRWALMALGEVDYGLVGIVGGLTGFVSFFNSILSVSVGRFYAFSVGAASVAEDVQCGLEECRKWFNTAFVLHTVISVVLVVIGYPIGLWAIREFLTIPLDRIEPCVWVWRFVCVGCFVGMFTVPFSAMYTAKQYIAELTIYSFVTTTLNVIVLYYMVIHPSDWLVQYSFWTMLVAVIPCVIIATRAMFIFPECRFNVAYFFSRVRFAQLLAFSVGRAFGIFAGLLSNQGVALAVNKLLGPAKNATMALGRGVMGHTMTLAGAMSGAFSPAITTAAGAGDFCRMHRLVFATCTYSSLGMLVFCIPFCLEAEEVLRLWLKNPPNHAAEFCVCLAVMNIVERMCEGHWMAIFATGRIVKFQIVESVGSIVDFFAALLLMMMGYGIIGVGVALVLGRVYALCVKIYYGWRIAEIGFCAWFLNVFAPISVFCLVVFACGCLPRLLVSEGFLRVCLTSIVCLAVSLPVAWFVVIRKEDRMLIANRVATLRHRIGGGK